MTAQLLARLCLLNTRRQSADKYYAPQTATWRRRSPQTAIAAAADLTRRARYYPAPAPVHAPIFNWTGFYIGINGGGGFGSSNWDSTGSCNVSGGLVGGTAGYNYQFGQVVAGIEGDIDWSSINGTTNNLCPLGCKTSNTWLATTRGRVGYAADRFPHQSFARRRKLQLLNASSAHRHKPPDRVPGG